MKPKHYLKIILIVTALVVGFFGVQNLAQAQDTSTAISQISFPISDLGDCANAKECRTYCDILENADACATFGKSHGLIKSTESDSGNNLKSVKVGPGGCTSKDACKTYCSDPTHADECAKFASDHKLLK